MKKIYFLMQLILLSVPLWAGAGVVASPANQKVLNGVAHAGVPNVANLNLNDNGLECRVRNVQNENCEDGIRDIYSTCQDTCWDTLTSAADPVGDAAWDHYTECETSCHGNDSCQDSCWDAYIDTVSDDPVHQQNWDNYIACDGTCRDQESRGIQRCECQNLDEDCGDLECIQDCRHRNDSFGGSLESFQDCAQYCYPSGCLEISPQDIGVLIHGGGMVHHQAAEKKVVAPIVKSKVQTKIK